MSRPSLWMRFVAWKRRGKIVWLLHPNGEQLLSVAEQGPWGWWAPVYWQDRIGIAVLDDDGKCSGRDCYVKEWRPYA